jgi:hypothetical protein
MQPVIVSPIPKQITMQLGLLVYLILSACGAEENPRQVGRIAHPLLIESSGLVASRQHADLFWTHNDGNRPVLYGIKREGSTVAEFRIEGVAFEDWEDIVIDGANNLFLADTGNNKRQRRQVAVYMVGEPDPAATKTVSVTRRWVLRYPKEPFDSEGLFVWEGAGYLLSKVTDDQKAEIFRFTLKDPEQTLEFVARLDVESPVTAADISRDGKYLAVLAKAGPFVFDIGGDVKKAGEIKPKRIKFKHDSMEGCCFVPGGVVTCAESREIYFFSEEVFGLQFK